MLASARRLPLLVAAFLFILSVLYVGTSFAAPTVTGTTAPTDPVPQLPSIGKHELINAPKSVLAALKARQDEKAARLLIDAARRYPEAEHNLGVLFATGQAGRKDATAARGRFRQAADRGYAQSFFNLAIMALEGEAGPVSPLEAYSWLELYRRAIEKLQPGAETRRKLAMVSLAQERMASFLSADEVKEALRRADEFGKPSNPLVKRSVDLIGTAKTLMQYTEMCRGFSNLNEGFRSVDYRLRDEKTYGDAAPLLACVSVVEQVMSRKVCDRREITLREMLFYLSILEQTPVHTMPPENGVATALVIGGYCKPEVRQPKEAQEAMQRMRDNYRSTYP